ncbi:nodal modulator 1-like [Mizuhopecten yessoensis]|uniref:Nodal modulator 2 n=1 Tax=Mizuhopecten yessoensis TaxID=6573 RepID=A0A210QDD6_MIZYE|nr:nodal modulator 1-like [Mizuhopecten yessoensis]OWF46756.1 Nodal modulator 2 [Mizuhopecten yessoensis]
MSTGSVPNLLCFSYILFIFVALLCPRDVAADGVLGCGGFVRSDVDINFSLVEVKLYTPHGSIKYQTDCAPNTGYYLIPLYEKGDFVLKVEPPAGWSFEPESVSLKVDGSTDHCSLGEDINFRFTGFSIFGKVVSKGQDKGPTGINVILRKQGSSETLLTTVTGEDGKYTFAGVLPGEYDVKASQSEDFNFLQAEAKVTVTNDNTNTGNSIVIAGYKVKGAVQSEGEPIKGVNFVLFSSSFKKEDITGCEKSPLKGFTTTDNTSPLCYTSSSTDGSFTFPALPVGKFYIIPFYKGEHIRFDVLPGRLDIEVQHGPVTLKEIFQVEGFSVSGRVLTKAGGAGVSGATVLVGGKTVSRTEADGLYHLENMKTGTYRIQIQTDNIYFDEVTVKITPNTPNLPDILASDFKMCGKIVISQLPETLRQVTSQRRIIIIPQSKNMDASSAKADADGNFCAKVKPGIHVVQVHMTEEEKAAGLSIVPSEKTVTVTDKPVMDVTFSQFQAKVTGTVICLEKCGPVEISLESDRRGEVKQITQVKEAARGGTFQFDNVLPGKYKVTLLQDSWCWKEKTLDVEVASADLSGIEFTQTGYILKCSISHEIKLDFAHEKKEGTVGSFQLNKGTNRFCLAQPGVYRLTPDSCHKFDKDVFTYDTSNPELLTLAAVRHLMEGTVTTEELASDIQITVVSLVEQDIVNIGPLTTARKPPSTEKGAKPVTGPFVYKFTHWARSGERLEVSAKSKELLFSPSKAEILVHGDTCVGEVVKFTGKRGVFINGQIKPALAGVSVTVVAKDDSMDPIVMETVESGTFSVGPLHSSKEYSVSAEKTGYVLVKEDGQTASFKAYKLGQVSVQVMNEKDQPLSNVLLSLSGERQYRSNNVTGDNGTINFIGLSPGEYYLRPMMKEYKFDPASQTIEVMEGTTKKITIKGLRVAYSCYGSVTSLNGEPEQGVIVEAVGTDKCGSFQEESKTEPDGSYRIRGLQPKCTYTIHLKSDVNRHIERAAPKSQQITVVDSDFTDVSVIAFRRVNQMDISGNVITQEEHLPSLKVRLYRDETPDSPIHTVSLGTVTFFFLPSLPIDNEQYTIKLESSLSKASFEFTLPTVNFVANTSYQHHSIKFSPLRKSFDQEFIQGTSLFLPFSLLLAAAVYNYQKILPYLMRLRSQAQSMLAASQTDTSMSGTGDAGLGSDLQMKKKMKARKTS